MPEREVRTVAVVGAGTMGPGMSATFARYGIETRLSDIKPEVLEVAKRTVDTVYGTLREAGFLTADEATASRARIQFATDVMSSVRDADFVVEAIPERLDLKQQFFREVEEHVGDDTVLASNTSGIPITKLGEAVRHPGRIIGMHWSNPPHLIPVIEVIRSEQTGDCAVEITRRLVKRIGMIPVLVRRDVPGFVENRILYAIMREALDIYEQGIASAEDIDTVVKWGIGYKLAVIGPLGLLDVAGLEIYHAVASYLNKELSNRTDVSPLIRKKVGQGELGIKTGRGVFQYNSEDVLNLSKRRAQALIAVRKALDEHVHS